MERFSIYDRYQLLRRQFSIQCRTLLISRLPAVLASMIPAVGLATGSCAAGDSELAKQSQNPVGALISLPLENNVNFDTGPSGERAYVSNFKPVYPVAITEDINLINRAVIPLTYLEEQNLTTPPGDCIDLPFGCVAPDTSSEFGLGNVQYQAFFSPSKPGRVIWGVGPVIEMPTNTDDRLGTDTWSAGPAAVVLSMPGNWVLGMLAQNIWDFSKDGDEADINKALIQPIINYNLQEGWYLSATTTITANWEAESGEEWTVPLGGGVGRLLRIGKQPVDMKLMGYWNAEKPRFGADYSLQFTVKILFPKS